MNNGENGDPCRVSPRINRDKADCRDGSCEDRKTPAHTGAEGWDGKSPAGSLAPAIFIDIKGGQNHKKCYLRAMNQEDIYRGRKAKSAWQKQTHKDTWAVHSADQELGKLLSTLLRTTPRTHKPDVTHSARTLKYPEPWRESMGSRLQRESCKVKVNMI